MSELKLRPPLPTIYEMAMASSQYGLRNQWRHQEPFASALLVCGHDRKPDGEKFFAPRSTVGCADSCRASSFAKRRDPRTEARRLRPVALPRYGRVRAH